VKFGPVAPSQAVGAILAHTVRAGDVTLRKGRVLAAGDVAALSDAGLEQVVVARLDAGDVHEDEAAFAIARAVAGAGVRADKPFTGRANLFAEAAGVACVERAAVSRINGIDAAITLATVPEFAPVTAGQMVATVKIIPFAVARALVEEAGGPAAVSVAFYARRQVGLVATLLPSLKASVMDKTRALLAQRLEAAGASLLPESRVAHEAEAVGSAVRSQLAAGAEVVIVFGASAVADAADVIPAAIAHAGGVVERIGMPVDPGNLLVLGNVDGTPVIGAPGCARSSRENGFDWVLRRVLANIPVTSAAIADMGVGGLLSEIATRPQPRGRHS
jgi:molybdenum cofactor cytidylyltransferase